jgi:hypothetical protein
MNSTKKMVYFGILTSLGLALHILEGFIPNPFIGIVPGAKIGLANIIGLMTLVLFGLKFALVSEPHACFDGGSADRSSDIHALWPGRRLIKHNLNVACPDISAEMVKFSGSKCAGRFGP